MTKDDLPRSDGGVRLNDKGEAACESCGGRPRWGWVYKFGTISMATCEACPEPPSPWFKGLEFDWSAS